MRGQKTCEIDGKQIVVKELTIKQIKSLFDFADVPNEASANALLDHFGGKILPLCTNLTMDDLEELRPSDAAEIWEAVREVNATFFGIAKLAGLKEIAVQLRNSLIADCLNSVASSLAEATATPSTTDTAISSEQSIEQ